MSSLELAIRRALEKAGEATQDASQRAHIYQSARNALENGLRKQGVSNPGIVSEQRKQLEDAIHAIEADYRAERPKEPEKVAPEPAPVEPVLPWMEAAPEVDAPSKNVEADEPSLDFAPEGSRSKARKEPDLDVGASPEAEEPHISLDGAEERHEKAEPATGEIHDAPARAVKPRRVRRWRAKAFALVTLLVFAGMGWWWIETSGLLLTAEQRDTSVPNPPPSVTDEDFEGAQQLKSMSRDGDFGPEWTLVYEAGRTGDKQDVGAAATASLKNGGMGPYLDVQSNSSEADGSVAFEIPQNLVAQMQGQASSIAVTVQGSDKPVQLAIECDFGGLGNCGRHRFLLSANRSDLLFQVDVNPNGEVSGPGKLIFNPDAGGEAKAVKVYTIHIRPSSGAAQ